MKVTDYSKIASVYDHNDFRVKEVGVDQDLESFISNSSIPNLRVLDLACGTGIYLQRQTEHFGSDAIEWHALDASKEMLEKAKQKVDAVEFVYGQAEDLPYDGESFDFIANNYAFHHFTEKEQVLDEVVRVLKKDGRYKMHNTDFGTMENWWVYHYFPSAYEIDAERYWSKEKIYYALKERGLKVSLDVHQKMGELRVRDYLHHVENKDISVFTLIDEKAFEEGKQRMIDDVAKDPEKTIVNQFSKLNVVAEKR
ncbi:class I SAM-dependent methyltransferase [Thalassobacillus hwangdonensis]|uniref:Class I SAM-dependent methyltransferase n=1 Tax=Thalassobacillus hwangdonensis TaxID=546108 RepID=A0ABW3L727_9BACI